MCMIDVLLATYNGARYLPELLASLEHQTHSDWRLIVRDDGSTDGTLAVIEAWARQKGDSVRVLHDGVRGLGACANFAALLEASDAPYFMFCDQDDIWLPEKMSALLHSIRQVELRRGAETPVLAHSDLMLVDDSLSPLHKSFWNYQRVFNAFALDRSRQLILSNYVTGCASIGNAALRRAAQPIPTEAIMHDWWLALVSANLGEVVENHQRTVLYRQHGSNALGAKPWSLSGVAARFVQNPFAAAERTRSIIQRTQRQAAVFCEMFENRLDPEILELFHEYARLHDQPFWRRKTFFFSRRLWPSSFVQAATLWWFV